jgi:hypothetical protein
MTTIYHCYLHFRRCGFGIARAFAHAVRVTTQGF